MPGRRVPGISGGLNSRQGGQIADGGVADDDVAGRLYIGHGPSLTRLGVDVTPRPRGVAGRTSGSPRAKWVWGALIAHEAGAVVTGAVVASVLLLVLLVPVCCVPVESRGERVATPSPRPTSSVAS